MNRYVSLFRSFCLRLCVVVTLGVLLLAAVELYSYRHYRQSAAEALEPAVKLDLAQNASAGDREFWKEFEQANRVVYHQYVLWRRAPYSGDLISINADGVRRTLHTHCQGKAFTIWTFGDSVMWGAAAPDAGTIPSYLALDYENAGMPACIVNYAEKGWSNTQETVALIELLKHATRKPDLVLFYDGGSEAFAAYQNGEADVHSNFGQVKNFLDNWHTTQTPNFNYFRQTNTYRLLARIAARAPFHHLPQPSASNPDTETLSQAVIENYLQNMDIVGLLAKQFGFRPVFAWYPNLTVGHKEMTSYEQEVLRLSDREFPGLSAMYRAVYQRGHEIRRPEFHELDHLVDDQKASLYVGISHMKPEGNRIAADRLFDLLQTKP